MNAKTISEPKPRRLEAKKVFNLLASEKAAIILSFVAVLGEWYGAATSNDKLTAIWALIAMPFIFRGAFIPQKGVKK